MFGRNSVALALALIAAMSLSAAGAEADLGPVERRAQDGNGNSNAARCRARYYAARFALDRRPECSIMLCRDILARDNAQYMKKAWELMGEAQNRIANYREAANAFKNSGNRIRQAKAWYRAGEYRRAAELLRAEMAVPEKPPQPANGLGRGPEVGITPKPIRLRIWIALCKGRLGGRNGALSECLALIRTSPHSWHWWNQEDTARLARAIVENADTPDDWNEVRQFARKHRFKQLQEYFRAIELVDRKDAAEVVKYLTRSDVPVANTAPAL